MSVSVSMPQLGESVTEGTVTRWLKKEGERVEADEPLLEVSTDKVDTEIPSPVSGILRGITVAEDETVAVGAELAVIDETDGAGPAAQPGPEYAAPGQPPAAEYAAPPAGPEYAQPSAGPEFARPPAGPDHPPLPEPGYHPPAPEQAAPAAEYPPPAQPGYPPMQPAGEPPAPAGGYGSSLFTPADQVPPAAPPAPEAPPAPDTGPAAAMPAEAVPAPPAPAAPAPAAPAPAAGAGPVTAAPPPGAEGPYVTPLVRKLAAEHGVDLATVTGTGVGGRIRKQDVIEAARQLRESAAAAPAAPAAQAAGGPAVAGQPAPGAPAPARTIVPSTLRGTTERMSRARQLIARRMVESLQTSAQLTTVVEADVTPIARLRARAKADFEAREGVKLSFLPFFALAAVEALKVHPRLNALIDTEAGQVIYHDAEHLGVAVDTERGLMVPVIRNAGDLNIGGLARKIADLAARTRAGQVSPDDLAGGTFTLTNTGSRGALFDTPIINQPQVAILGTGTVVKRAVVMEDPALGEVIAVRSMVYLALTYDHRLVDGADAARFLTTVKDRLEEGAFEAELGL
ncbi:MAG TPA: 2-oxoglutarate dehydrogenase, E2 component, dihydrolipoamide succinyltransferase [Streptosporangiaceae bacterium]|nr:2-oxoglutarate dehydrogenase, E2 component, dihydrolipoamide succinyltransferase [Streptosporangiaceae bacterium]